MGFILLPQTLNLRINLLLRKAFDVDALRRTHRHARSAAHTQTRIDTCRPPYSVFFIELYFDLTEV